jgi:hypothetical protein
MVKIYLSSAKEIGSVLKIKYNSHSTYDMAISNISTISYLSYIYTGTQGKPQLTWVVSSSMMLDSDIEIDNVVDDSYILTIYHKFLSFFSQSESNSQSLHHMFDHAIELINYEESEWILISMLSEHKLSILRENLLK